MTLQVQQFLRDGGSIHELKETLGINCVKHDELPLVILNYDQIDSPKLHPIVRECRGLVLDSRDWSIAARSFSRFFNLGECPDEQKDFVWEDCTATEKMDGSLALLYYYDKSWRVNTRGSFASQKPNGCPYTWKELFWKGFLKDYRQHELHKISVNFTYVFELTSIYNKIVRQYHETRCFLLSVFDNNNGEELSAIDVNTVAKHYGLAQPEMFTFESAEDVQKYLIERSKIDPTFEGVVLRDRNNMRIKVKSATYVALHHLKGNDNIFLAKNLVPLVLNGETKEVLTYFPEIAESLERVRSRMDEEFERMMRTWERAKHEEYQKNFALAIKGETLFGFILFDARKSGRNPAEIWKESGDEIVKILFKPKK